MNKVISLAPLFFSLFLISGCGSDSKKSSENKKTQNKYQQCLQAHQAYLEAHKGWKAAELKSLQASLTPPEDFNAAEKKRKAAQASKTQAREQLQQAEKALQAFNAEGHAHLEKKSFCKLNVLCPPARERYKTLESFNWSLRGSINHTKEEKAAIKKEYNEAKKIYESFADKSLQENLDGDFCS